MENQGFSPNQTIDSISKPLGRADFKLPLNYTKVKKEIWKHSEFSSLVGFLNERAAKADSLVSLCLELLNYSGFNSFKTIHFFQHEKGQSFAQKHEISATKHDVKELHVNEFNHLFQSIKKSKNRTFGQESLKGFDFDILGTFLAREFALGNYNIILIVSRNDFLPQTAEEKESFAKVMTVIAPYFNTVLDRELLAQQSKKTKLVFENLPYKIDVSLAAGQGYRQLPSGRHYKVQTEGILDKADIYHQERIALLGELLNTLKHELSNPLFGLQLSAELLTHDLEDEEHSEFMSEICSSIKRSQSIISNFTELYTSNEEISPKELEKMVHEIFRLTKSESRQILKTYKVDGAVPEEAIISANSVWLAQILFNLIVNSAQALNQHETQNPQITVTASFKKPFELHIRDNGPGAGAGLADSMFKPFYTTKEKGTGLGLAISQSLAKKLNGKIDYIPEGQGAHFVLRLNA